MPPEVITPAAPEIPDYELLRLIGRGSYGDVWLARSVTGLYRAVKIVWRSRFTDSQPFEREFRGLREFAAISLAEVRQLALLHVGRNHMAGFFYYVMELADDAETGRVITPHQYVPKTLKEMRVRHGRMPASKVVDLGVDLARALAGLHTRGLVHRDIKPSNVIFVDAAPKLADIGLVAAVNTTNTFVGTEGFVPPEGPGAPSADVFSLGKLLYEIATGLDRNDYPRLPPNLGNLPDRKELLELNEILIRACDVAPAQRYFDAGALLDDLLLLQAGRSMRRLRMTERRLSRALRGIMLLFLVTLIAGAGAYVERQRAIQENILRREAEAERDAIAHKAVYVAGLAKSQRALELGDLGHARQELVGLTPKSGEVDLRGFEWFALWAEARGDPADVLREHGPIAEKVRFSSDGHMLAVQSADQSVTLWDTTTLKPLRTILGVHRLAGFSFDGRWLVGSDSKFAFQRWLVSTGEVDAQPLSGVNRPLASVSKSDCGVCFTDGLNGAQHTLRIWDFGKHVEIGRLPVTAETDTAQWDFYRAAISADGRICALALVSGRGFEARWKLQFIELSSPHLLREELVAHLPSALALSPDGDKIAIAFRDNNEVEIRDVPQGKVLWRKAFSANATNMIAFAPDGLRLAIAGREQVVRVVDALTGTLLNELRGHEAGVEDIGWSPDGLRLVSIGSAGDLRFWRSPLHKAHFINGGFWAPVAGYGNVITSHDGAHLAVTRDGKNVDVLRSDNFELVASIPDVLRPLAFTDEDRTLIALTAQGVIQCWQLIPTVSLKTQLPLFEGHAAIGVTLSSDKHWLAASDSKGKLRIWDWPERRLLHDQLAHTEYVWSVAFSADGEAIASSGADGQAKIWQTRTARRWAGWVSSTDISMVQFSPRGGELVLALGNGDIELHDPRTLSLNRTMHTGSARVNVFTFSPDGTRLLCGASNGQIHVFSTDDWHELVTLTAANASLGNAPAVVDLNFSAQAKTLAAYLADGEVRVWRW